MNPNYKRVSKKRKCLICGKPDWCSYTQDAKISFCARIAAGADRVSRTGWGVFYHGKSLFSEEPLPFPNKPPPKKAELAPIEIRDFVYRKLIALSPASRSDEIINGPKGLRSRKIFDFENYGSLPRTQSERNDFAKQIRQALNRNFPLYTRQQKAGLAGLPGFWIDKNGNSRLWMDKDYRNPMLLIPYRENTGLIQACQIRFFGQFSKDSVRYLWLSTPQKSGGISTGTPLHFVSYQESNFQKPVLITEGALKGETVRRLRNDFDIIANSGVSCSHQEIVEKCRFRTVFLAFDNDYFENIYVAQAIFKLIQKLIIDAQKFKFSRQISILTWKSHYKGIDNALLGGSSILVLSLYDWFKNLSSEFQYHLKNQFPFPSLPNF